MKANIVYVDNPVGYGFSYADNPKINKIDNVND